MPTCVTRRRIIRPFDAPRRHYESARDIVHQPRTFTSPCATDSTIRTYVCTYIRERTYAFAHRLEISFHHEKKRGQLCRGRSGVTRIFISRAVDSLDSRTFGFFSSLVIRRLGYDIRGLDNSSLRNRRSFCNKSILQRIISFNDFEIAQSIKRAIY